jgi:hypothetical protein
MIFPVCCLLLAKRWYEVTPDAAYAALAEEMGTDFDELLHSSSDAELSSSLNESVLSAESSQSENFSQDSSTTEETVVTSASEDHPPSQSAEPFSLYHDLEEVECGTFGLVHTAFRQNASPVSQEYPSRSTVIQVHD